MIPHIQTKMSVTYQQLDGTPKQVGTDHHNYNSIVEILRNETISEEVQERLTALADPLQQLFVAVKGYEKCLQVDSSGMITFTSRGKSLVLPADLSLDLLEIHKEGNDITPFILFVDKLIQNPDQRIVSQLWGFIKVCGLCITPEGNFLAYKNVNSDFTSIYDGQTDNTPGTVLVMPRKHVNNDPTQTCSDGLHFAAWGYLRHYSSGGKTVLVSISPADVVSIPVDYSNQKGRACRYKIVREVAQPEELKNIKLFDEDGTDYDDETEDYEFNDLDYCPDCDTEYDSYADETCNCF